MTSSTLFSASGLSASHSARGTENMLLITTRRNQKQSRPGMFQVCPVDDALSGDGFHKGKTTYEHLKTVTPVLNPELKQAIQQYLADYERETGMRIPPACRKRVMPPNNSASTIPPCWETNKQTRLKAGLCVFNRLHPASQAKEAINQLACVLALLETETASLLHLIPEGFSLAPTPLRLTEPVQETVNGKSILVSYGIRHVSLFNQHGAVQIQCLPEHLRGADYQQRAALPGVIILNKAGADRQAFW